MTKAILLGLFGVCLSAQVTCVTSIQLPIEVIGLDGTTRGVEFYAPSSGNGATLLSLQIHGLKYETQASVQINGSTWIPINTSTVTLLGLAKAYGGIGGGFHTLKLTLPLPAGSIVAGVNTLTFKFNGTDGVNSGFRVLALNVLDANGNALIPASSFTQEDPNTWQPPFADALNIAAGKSLWYGVALTVPSTSGGAPVAISAHCTDCHAEDGRDLKYFNYSNNSIRARSMFHGLTTQQGDQIASYIRSLNVANPGRPWNPPYQPGPGLDSLPIANWAAGAGLDATLDSDAAMQAYLAPGGSTAGWSANQVLNMRELPLAIQLPDWNAWLPIIHPADAYGPSWTTGQPTTYYLSLRSLLIPNNPARYADRTSELGNWALAVTKFAGQFQFPTTAAGRQALVSIGLWQMVKRWELNQEYGLESMTQAVYGATAESRAWYGSTSFDSSPNILHTNPGPGIGNGSNAVWDYDAHKWYQLQIVLNDGNGHESDTRPIDYGYVVGTTLGLSLSGKTPEGMLLLVWVIKGLQENTEKNQPPASRGFNPKVTNSMILVHPMWEPVWSGTSSTTRAALTQAYTIASFTQLQQFTAVQYYTGGYASPTEDPSKSDMLITFGGNIWNMLPRLRAIGVDPNLTYQISAWASGIWPAGNWQHNNAIVCVSTSSCTF